ncbi:MAG: tRNA (adenosine(37)-N6)-dimethylallyltransferase MiaA [SAR324 cluster bacterium]|nr:tRNA (adenosine(37)-N6)-dimethylallyltransferase MiaA [SAR324 cluster bacterium]
MISKLTNNLASTKILVVVGATAAGKSLFSLQAAKEFSGEVVSADSIQIYKHLNIASAKPSLADRAKIRHHLIDELELDQAYNSAIFKKLADRAIEKISKKNKLPIICGSAMLYIKALLYGLADIPEISKEIIGHVEEIYQAKGIKYCVNWLEKLSPQGNNSFADPQRIKRALAVILQTNKPIEHYQAAHSFKNKRFNYLMIEIRPPRELIYQKINQRVDQMIENGLLTEVKNLIDKGYDPKLRPLQSIGYKQVIKFLNDELTYQQMIDDIKQKTRHYAKRQLTWFRTQANPLPATSWDEAAKDTISNFLSTS